MFYAKHRSRRKKMKFVKGIAMLLCLVTIFTSVWVGNLGIGAGVMELPAISRLS